MRPRKDVIAVTDALTVKEAAARWRVAPKTMRKMIKNGQVPAFKVGGVTRVSSRALDELLVGKSATLAATPGGYLDPLSPDPVEREMVFKAAHPELFRKAGA
jgi:excisionase family DNA binding protein